MRMSIPLLLLLLVRPALAHDLWLERDTAGIALYQGHKHSAHGGARTIPYGASFVKEAVGFDAAGRTITLPMPKSSPWRVATTDFAAVRVAVSSGYWTKTPWATRNVPKTGVTDAIKSWLSEASVKRIDRWVPGVDRPLTEGLEITPAVDPFALKPGDTLVALVTKEGKPKGGVPVAYGDVKVGATDEDGRLAIRLRHRGTQLITATVESPLGDGKADVVISGAVLQFELK